MKKSLNFKFYLYLIAGIISATSFLASLTIHILTFWNINIQDRFPFVWLLHIGIFVIGVPIFISWKLEDMKGNTNDKLPKTKNESSFQTNDTKSPFFIICVFVLAILLMPYIAFNFFINSFLSDGDPEIRNGTYVLNYEGDFKEISKEEYEKASAKIMRGFSGHWLFFYLFFTLIEFKETKDIYKSKRSNTNESRNATN